MKKCFIGVMSIAIVALMAVPASAQLSSYSQDFEGLDPAGTPIGVPGSLAADGWNAFNNVFDAGGGFIYQYPSVLSQGGAQFAGIPIGEGGPSQGAQQLTVYSDYNNPDHGNCGGTPTPPGPGDPTDPGCFLIETNVFQEQVIGAGDAGTTWTFSWDHKKGNIEGTSTALAFIKVLDPNAGFGLSAFPVVDTTSIPVEWGGGEIVITIDPAWAPGGTGPDGHILQFGFANTTTNFQGSANFYDNVNFVLRPLVPANSRGSLLAMTLLLLTTLTAVAVGMRKFVA